MKRIVRQRLLLRVYLHGILMLSLAAGASFVVGSYVLRPAVELPTRPSTAWIAWHMMAIADQPERLTQELASLKRRAHLEITLFDAEGRRIASNAATPPGPLTTQELGRLGAESTHFADGVGLVADLGADGQVRRYARVRYPAPELPLGTALAQLAVALLVLALLSIPLARSVTAPVDSLAALARAFGGGDLAVRSRSARGDEIGDLARAFDEMAERIVGLRRSEKELLANVSHELRTPLARIRLALELLIDGDTTRAKSYLGDIEDDLGELERLLDDIMTMTELDLARGSGGDALPPLRREVIPGERLLALARERFGRRYDDRKLEFRADDALPSVDADPSLLRRVLDNLLDNAVKFSEPGEAVELEGVRGDDGELVITVRDHGMGIAAADLERVFEPFFRSDRSRSRSTGGVGLGLAVVRRILTAHGGRVSVQSEGARGAEFRVVVPPADATSSSKAVG